MTPMDIYFQYGCPDCKCRIGIALEGVTKTGAPAKALGGECLMCGDGPPEFIRQFRGYEDYAMWVDSDDCDGVLCCLCTEVDAAKGGDPLCRCSCHVCHCRCENGMAACHTYSEDPDERADLHCLGYAPNHVEPLDESDPRWPYDDDFDGYYDPEYDTSPVAR